MPCLGATPRDRCECDRVGFFATDVRGGRAKTPEVQAANETPMHRIGQPDDIKALALFLASRTCACITGQDIVIDGGWGLGGRGLGRGWDFGKPGFVRACSGSSPLEWHRAKLREPVSSVHMFEWVTHRWKLSSAC